MRNSGILKISEILVVLLIEELRGKLTLTDQRGSTQISVRMRHQFGIYTVVPKASFRREISDGVARYGLFSQAFTVKHIQRTL